MAYDLTWLSPVRQSNAELPNAPPPNARAVRPDAFRAVCDTMVQGLGKKLRSIGADVVILGQYFPRGGHPRSQFTSVRRLGPGPIGLSPILDPPVDVQAGIY